MAGFFGRLKEGLSRSSAKINTIFADRTLDAASLEELEDELIAADLGPEVADKVLKELKKQNKSRIEGETVRDTLAKVISEALEPLQAKDPVTFSGKKPYVVLMVGVNGTGKTTSIGKLGAKLSAEGKKVAYVAADTFRAAAVEQLQIWGERGGIEVFSAPQGADSAALVHRAYEQASQNGVDVLLIDTAGRLHNKSGLMEELAKIIRVLKKLCPDAPHTTLLTLDATTGQNALEQVRIFSEMANITGLIVTKLDGTARGGVIVALAEQTSIPVLYVGVGEKIEDLQPFSAKAYAENLVSPR